MFKAIWDFFSALFANRLGIRAGTYYLFFLILWAIYWFSGLFDHSNPNVFNIYGVSQVRAEDILPPAILSLIAGVLIIYLVVVGFASAYESKFIRTTFKQGEGGSARWSGVLSFRNNALNRAKHAPIYFGRTRAKHDPRIYGRKIAGDDESHLVTIAQSGAGKSTSVINLNLVKYPYPDSVVVLDPKGEHTEQTSHFRAAMGQTVRILDAFSITNGHKTHGFNPLAQIDLQSPKVKEIIEAIADACVIPEGSVSSTEAHFNNLQRAMVAGIIAHLLTTRPRDEHHLPAVYEKLMSLADSRQQRALLNEMKRNRGCGNLPLEAVAMYEQAGNNEKGSIFTTTIKNVKWISSPGMRELLMKDELDLSILRTQKTSLYVVLPFEAMDAQAQGRFMRMLVNLSFAACRNNPMPPGRERARTLFILDEVAQLGAFPALEKGYQTLRGANVKIWSFYQQYSGMKNQVKDEYALIGNSTCQFFGVNDTSTAKAIEGYIGTYKNLNGTREIKRPLLDATEITEYLGQHAMTQIVKMSTGEIMQLRRDKFIPQSTDRPKKSQPGTYGFNAFFSAIEEWRRRENEQSDNPIRSLEALYKEFDRVLNENSGLDRVRGRQISYDEYKDDDWLNRSKAFINLACAFRSKKEAGYKEFVLLSWRYIVRWYEQSLDDPNDPHHMDLELRNYISDYLHGVVSIAIDCQYPANVPNSIAQMYPSREYVPEIKDGTTVIKLPEIYLYSVVSILRDFCMKIGRWQWKTYGLGNPLRADKVMPIEALAPVEGWDNVPPYISDHPIIIEIEARLDMSVFQLFVMMEVFGLFDMRDLQSGISTATPEKQQRYPELAAHGGHKSITDVKDMVYSIYDTEKEKLKPWSGDTLMHLVENYRPEISNNVVPIDDARQQKLEVKDADTLFSPAIEARLAKWSLPNGYTRAQLETRFVELSENAASDNEVSVLMDEYTLLYPFAKLT